jgi:transcription initiation factor IIE alpha subunit
MNIPAYEDARRDPQLHGPALAVYLHLLHDVLDCADFRPVKQLALASETGFSERTIERVIALLIDRGYIERGPVRKEEARVYRLVYRRRAA